MVPNEAGTDPFQPQPPPRNSLELSSSGPNDAVEAFEQTDVAKCIKPFESMWQGFQYNQPVDALTLETRPSALAVQTV
jgi:hypothetical protein